MITIYTEQELKELRRAIYDNAVEQLLWQIMYVEAVAHNTPNCEAIRKKLLSLPKAFELIILNTVKDSPAVRKLIQSVYEANRLFVQYVDCVFRNGNNESALVNKLHESVHSIADCLHQMNPQWGTAPWITMMNHHIKLMDTIMNDAKTGKQETLTDILPNIRRLKMDMAEYLAHGICTNDQPEQQNSQAPQEESPMD